MIELSSKELRMLLIAQMEKIKNQPATSLQARKSRSTSKRSTASSNSHKNIATR
jgi:hypothetical protein